MIVCLPLELLSGGNTMDHSLYQIPLEYIMGTSWGHFVSSSLSPLSSLLSERTSEVFPIIFSLKC